MLLTHSSNSFFLVSQTLCTWGANSAIKRLAGEIRIKLLLWILKLKLSNYPSFISNKSMLKFIFIIAIIFSMYRKWEW